MISLGKVLIAVGLISAAVGVVFIFGGNIPWLGHLPGDITIQRKNCTFFFPVTTSILTSIAISLLLMFLKRR